MRKSINFFLLLLFFLFNNNNLFSQGITKACYENAKEVKESKFVVMLNDKETAIDDSIKSAVKKYWTFCDYNFIKASEYDTYLIKKNYSMLALVSETMEGSTDTSGYSYRLLLCSPKAKNSSVGYATKIILPYYQKNYKNILGTYDYLIPYIIKSTNDKLEECYASKGKVTDENKSKVTKGPIYITYTEGGSAKLTGKRILICKDGVIDSALVKKVLRKSMKLDSSKVDFVNSETIYKAIIEKRDDVAVIFGNDYGDYNIFSAGELKLLAYGGYLYIYYGNK